MRVLVVEDNADLGEVLREFFFDLGHRPLIVQSAEAALDVLAAEPPDLILLDIYLPGMSGLDFLQHPAVRASGVPVVAVSGHTTDAQARECLRLGAIEFLSKPLPLDHLREILELLAPHAPAPAPATGDEPADRRRAPRVRASLPVRVVDRSGVEWRTSSIDLSVSGIKVRAHDWGLPGPAVRLTFTLPGEETELTLLSLLARVDVDGYAFYFVNVTEQQLQRLRALVDQLGPLS